jgi:hypothetical protein
LPSKLGALGWILSTREKKKDVFEEAGQTLQYQMPVDSREYGRSIEYLEQ